MNWKRHETQESCSLIRPLVSKIFTCIAVYYPTDMQPPWRHFATTNKGKTSRCGSLSRLVATEVTQFVLYFLFLFEQFHHNPELPIGTRLVHALCIVLARILTRIFRMERSALHATLSPLLHRVPIRCGLYHQLCE